MSHSRPGADSGENGSVKPGLPRSAHRSRRARHRCAGRGDRPRAGCRARGARARRGGAGRPARPCHPAARLVGRSACLAAGGRRARAVADRRAAGQPGAPGQPGAQGADLGLGRGRAGGPVRARLGDRALRHDAVLGPHDPAHAPDPGGADPAAVRGTDHAAAARLVRGDASPVDLPAPALAGGPVPVVPRRVLAAVRGRDVGEPLLAAVRGGPGGRVDPPAGARAVPLVPRSCSGGRSSGPTRHRGG